MNIEIAKICGLCAGAKNALNTARKKIAEGNKVVLYKELLHNPLVMQSLLKDARLIEDIDKVNSDEYVIIRAHGEPKSTYDKLDAKNIAYSDCICPNVKRIHKLVYDKDTSGYKVIVIGKYGKGVKPMHPEVYGICGWCTDPILIQDEEDLVKLDSITTPCFAVCQTTFPLDKAEKLFTKIKEIFTNKNVELVIENTICNGQRLINESSVELAKNVDFMIVVGGKHSSNSVELYNNVSTYVKSIFVETEDECIETLQKENLLPNIFNIRVGITAGASTEKEVLENIKQRLIELEGKK